MEADVERISRRGSIDADASVLIAQAASEQSDICCRIPLRDGRSLRDTRCLGAVPECDVVAAIARATDGPDLQPAGRRRRAYADVAVATDPEVGVREAADRNLERVVRTHFHPVGVLGDRRR